MVITTGIEPDSYMQSSCVSKLMRLLLAFKLDCFFLSQYSPLDSFAYLFILQVDDYLG